VRAFLVFMTIMTSHLGNLSFSREGVAENQIAIKSADNTPSYLTRDIPLISLS